MGNTISCCNFSSPKLHRNAHSRPYRPKSELSCEDTGCNLQHISDQNNIDDLCMDFPPHSAWMNVALFTLVHSFQTQLIHLSEG
uniref:Uncharacterized protein n=1 Tax=Chelydra serpentina TaxID=8475 RepID=A0A8C3RLV2_CHESE